MKRRGSFDLGKAVNLLKTQEAELSATVRASRVMKNYFELDILLDGDADRAAHYVTRGRVVSSADLDRLFVALALMGGES